jgi:hypothetical protein
MAVPDGWPPARFERVHRTRPTGCLARRLTCAYTVSRQCVSAISGGFKSLAVEAADGMYPGVVASCGVLGDHIDEGQERRELVHR